MSRYAFLSLFLVACAADPDGPTPDPNTPPDAAAEPTNHGWLEVRMLPPAFEGDAPETSISGGFIAANNGCEHLTFGACEVRRCGVGVDETLASPGKLHLTFEGGEFGWDPGAFPVQFSADAIPWAAGEMIKIKSDGKDVPPFVVAAPSPKTLDAGFEGPMLDQTMRRSEPLSVQWPAVPGTVVVTIDQNARTDRPRTTITCTYSGPAGAAQINTDSLAKLSVTPTSYADTDVRAWLAEKQTVTAGDYSVELRALRNWSDQIKRYRVQ
jgi:hypothetical protein